MKFSIAILLGLAFVAIAQAQTRDFGAADINALVPDMTGQSGKVLGTNGTNVLWTAGGGGGGSSAGVSGSVQFSDGAGGFLADGTRLFWNNTTKRLGVGNAAPLTEIHDSSSGTTNLDHGITQENNNSTVAASGQLILKRSRGTFAAKTAILSGDTIGKIQGFGFGTIYNTVNPDANIFFSATQNFTATAHGTKIQFSVTPNNTVTNRAAVAINQDSGFQIFDPTAGGGITQYATPGGTPYGIHWPANQSTTNATLQNDGIGSLAWLTAFFDSANITSLDYDNRVAFDSLEKTSILYNIRQETDNAELTSHDWQLRRFYANDGSTVLIDYSSPTGVTLGAAALLWPNVDGTAGQVLSTNGGATLSWVNASGLTINGALNSNGISSFAVGNASGGGVIQATTQGTFVFGTAAGTGSTLASDQDGSLIHGVVDAGAEIEAGSSGKGSTASGSASGAGSRIYASGVGAEARGFAAASGEIVSSGTASLALGQADTNFNIVSSGVASIAIALTGTGSVTTSGNAAYSQGDLITNTANLSMTVGLGHISSSYQALTIGQYSLPTSYTPTSWVATDPAFVIGNGTGVGTEANAFQVDKDGHQHVGGHVDYFGATPILSADCGTGATIAGNDNVGTITLGTAATATCTLTFATAWTNAPHCDADDETAPHQQYVGKLATTTTLVLSSVTFTDADEVSYGCKGYQ